MIQRTGLLVFVLLLLLGLSAALVQAQEAQPTSVPDVSLAPTPAPEPLPATGVTPELFSWYTATGTPNLGLGLLYFVVGSVGALVTVYLFLGEFLPSMGGKGEYVKLQAQLEYFEDWRKQLLDAHWEGVKGKPGLTQEEVQLLMAMDRLSDDLDSIVTGLQRQMSSERWRLWILGFPLYVLLGGLFAATFGQDILQAMLIGFGWTAVAERFGASREQAVLKTFRDTQIEALRQQAVRGLDMEPLAQEVDTLRAALRTAEEFAREVRSTAVLTQARLEGTQELLALLQTLPPGTDRSAALAQVSGSLDHVRQAMGNLERTNGKG